VLAIGFRLVLPWAVIESIGMRGHIVVQWVIPGSIVKFKAIVANYLERLMVRRGSPRKAMLITLLNRLSHYSITSRYVRGKFH
jgi:hypothetical protein